MGKTTFVGMWGQFLFNDNKLVIKYDAWKEDCNENPLLSILATLNEQLKIFVTNGKLLSSLKQTGLKLGISSLPALLKFTINVSVEYFGISESIKTFVTDINSNGKLTAKELANKIKVKLQKK